MNTFYKSQFSYCPLSWIHGCFIAVHETTRLHERCLRIIYDDNTSSFTDILEIDNSVSAQHRNMRSLLQNYTNLAMAYLRNWSVIVLN